MRRQVMEELRATFRPEFLNRVDETIVFHRLGQEELLRITRNLVEELRARFASLGLDAGGAGGDGPLPGPPGQRRKIRRPAAAPGGAELPGGSGGGAAAGGQGPRRATGWQPWCATALWNWSGVDPGRRGER